MTRKSDRFERMVEKTLQQYQEFDDFLTDNGLLKEADVLNLLRREHRAVVRMVRHTPKVRGYVGDMIDRKDLIDRLKKRAS